ncbi:hypothetical protein PVAND_002340 [Polypedilum vanderplanki]|uniref:JmjC domain-containing protein n=1 Tax=Polypedilum vanderplanki TaxID=319348 RepID=A0A9J6BS55_POLVA|nr:hypothetical protein PVAND_002340 [Polypedilum vanderplanki]
MNNNSDQSTTNQSVFINFISAGIKRKNNDTEKETDLNENKNPKLQNESDSHSVSSFDYDDLITYSPESFDAQDDEDMLRDREEFLQFENCFNTSLHIPQCTECRLNKDCHKYNCRFYKFRKIERDNGFCRVVGFSDEISESIQIADIDLWRQSDPSILRDCDLVSRKNILRCVASQFCDLVKEEENVHKSYIINKKDPVLAWKRALYKIREMCDTCSTSIFNFHFVCTECGTVVCIDCFKERNEGQIIQKLSKSEKEERDDFFWLKCTDEMQHKMILSKMIPGNILSKINEQLHKYCDSQKIELLCSCRDDDIPPLSPFDKLDYQRNIQIKRRKKIRRQIVRRRSILDFEQNLKLIHHTYISQQSVLKFESPSESSESYSIFQCEWERSKPIVVANVKLNKTIWRPQYFLEKFGSVRHSLVNCQADQVIKRVPMRDFWLGFESYKNRLPHNSQNKMILKLKDWPDTQDFADVLQEHYNDLMNSIPFKLYTRRNGIFNLAKYQHLHFLKPDLGPKIYSAYGNFEKTTVMRASTNLHLDISDAVNILAHVSRPEDYKLANKQYDKEEISKVLEQLGCDEADLQTFMTSNKLPGALWLMFHSTDVNKLRNALREYAKENNIPLKSKEDPIHNQDWYVDVKLKRALEKKGIRSYSIIQYEGDCVFIPAKTPHQVTNIFDCIKIALDFVSPENVVECINLTNEFRLLSSKHVNREDKLQIKSILYHTIKNLVQPTN